MAEVFGCAIGMPPLLTAISFVALGTSMPDLFASKSAAVNDPTADAAIVNVTGSNCVNVFLGLGLPWTIGSIYWAVSDWDPEWEFKYPDIAPDYKSSGQMVFVVRSGDLVFSVCCFSIAALVALAMLVVRRRLIGGELGGYGPLKAASSLLMVVLWLAYIILSGWWSLRKNDSDDFEKTGVIAAGAAAVTLPSILFSMVACRTPTNWASELNSSEGSDEAEKKGEGAPALEDVLPQDAVMEPIKDPIYTSSGSVATVNTIASESIPAKIASGKVAKSPRTNMHGPKRDAALALQPKPCITTNGTDILPVDRL